MLKALHPRDRLHVSRKEGGRRLASIDYCVDTSRLEDHVKKSKERFITAANNNIGIINTDRKTIKTSKQKREKKKTQLQRYFKRQTKKGKSLERNWICTNSSTKQYCCWRPEEEPRWSRWLQCREQPEYWDESWGYLLSLGLQWKTIN